MQNVVPTKRSWMFLAAMLIAACVLLPAQAVLAQSSSPSTQDQDLIQQIKAVYFPFNIYSRVVDPGPLQSDATYLSQNTASQLWIQGYADIRGDIFYNLVLSYRRAQFVKSKLAAAGVDPARIQFATGWGKLYPVCQATDENCYQQQRRVDIVPPDHM